MHDPLTEIRARIEDELHQRVAHIRRDAQARLPAAEFTALEAELAEQGAAITAELHAPDATVESLRGFDWWTLLPSMP